MMKLSEWCRCYRWKTQPFNSGCHDRNYKGTESIILLVMIGPECELYVDVGVNGCNSDEGVWSKCTLKNILEQNTLNALTPTVLPGRIFFSIRVFFTDTDDSQDSRGRERTIFCSTLPLEPADECSDIYLQLCI